MRIRFLIPFVLLLVAAQDPLAISLTSPNPGDVLSGQVTVTGTTDVLGFTSWELDFSYASNPADTWFTLQTSTQPEADSTLTIWDTTLISDGEYILRLRVYVEDGTFQEVIVPVSVQNDAPIATATPVTSGASNPVGGQVPTPFLVASSPTPTKTPYPTPSPFPLNDAALTQNDISSSITRGALVILGFFIFAGLIIRFRRY